MEVRNGDPPVRVRWMVCALLFAAVTLSYVDRQVAEGAEAHAPAAIWLEREGYGDIAFWFQALYGVGYLVFGRFVDRVGAIGYAVAVALWTVGHMAHALVTSTAGLVWCAFHWGWANPAPFPRRWRRPRSGFRRANAP